MDAKAKIQGLYDEFQKLEAQAKTVKESKESILEEMEQLLDETGEEYVTVKNDIGETRFVSKETKIVEKTDKKAIANEAGVDNKEFKTKPYHISKFTKEGKITPDLIAKHTTPDEKTKIKIGKRPPNKNKNNEE